MMTIEEILQQYKKVAVVGLSANPDRPSHRVTAYLADQGYEITPVNPGEKEILGKTSYPNLSSIPDKLEIVDIFRQSAEALPIVEEAIKTGAKVIWMQEGVINEAAAARAREAGLQVVMDRCMLKEHYKLSQA